MLKMQVNVWRCEIGNIKRLKAQYPGRIITFAYVLLDSEHGFVPAGHGKSDIATCCLRH
jgi:hypothetical protein